ncbi:DnaJ -like protein subfamily C member 8 [Halotydeus destructor]|nr:DnaJ -like protein subfamily C member 8 [Halotydeus destructor]
MGDALASFFTEVKKIEEKDSIYTSDKQIARLLRPGSSYANLNPFEVLLLDPEAPKEDIKKQYKKLSILLHPDKNLDNRERAQSAFDIVTKAYKGLEDDAVRVRALEVVEEARFKVNQDISEKRKRQKKEGKSGKIDEDDPERFKQAVKVMTMKLFADYERKRRSTLERVQEETKRKREGEMAEEEKKKNDQEWHKNYEESREQRVGSWQTFQKKKSKKVKTGFKPPKLRPETRD